jgi:hypothetical protein
MPRVVPKQREQRYGRHGDDQYNRPEAARARHKSLRRYRWDVRPAGWPPADSDKRRKSYQQAKLTSLQSDCGQREGGGHAHRLPVRGR